MKPISRSTTFPLTFFVATLLWHGLFLPFSRGAYTDGILQIDCFRFGMTYWPPLYALMTRALSWIPGIELESAARTISLLAGAFVAIPLGALARRLFGLRAAFWAMTAWLISPMALRWSVQVMTDMPAAALWTGTLAALVIAVERYLPGMFPDDGRGNLPDPARGNRWLLAATALATATTMTRHQGILLLPLTLLAAWRLGALGRVLPGRRWNPWWTQAIWIVVPAWVLHSGMTPLLNHLAQFTQRAESGSVLETLLVVYWNTFESFVAVTPYCVTYGLFGFLLYGLFRVKWETARLRWAGWAALYLTLTIFVLQSVFRSFQTRYLLPLLPLVCLFAGHGLATWERRVGARSWRFWLLAGATVIYGLVFSAMVGIHQGNPFLDIKEASIYVRDEMGLDPEQRILTNERYGSMVGPKVNFWSGGHPVASLHETTPQPGDVILISSYDAGGRNQMFRLVGLLQRNPAVERVGDPFVRVAIPLLPDLMPEPIVADPGQGPISLNQDPMAWNMRYGAQPFITVLLRVRDLSEEMMKELEVELGPPPPPAENPRTRALKDQLETIGEQLDAIKNDAGAIDQ